MLAPLIILEGPLLLLMGRVEPHAGSVDKMLDCFRAEASCECLAVPNFYVTNSG